MEGLEKCNLFDLISDDVLLKILIYVPRKYWEDVSNVCQRFRNVCHDKEIFRVSNFECAYGLSEKSLIEYLRAGHQFIETLNLNHCYWFRSVPLANAIARCKKIQELYLLDCRLTVLGIAKIVCNMDCLKTLVVSLCNLLDFSNKLNGDSDLQRAFRHLEHFGLHIREESNTNGTARVSLQFHLSQQTTILEYTNCLKTFCVIGTPGMNQKLSRRLIHPLVVKTDHLSNLKTMSINSTNDATSRLYFFGILVKSFDQPDAHFKNLSVSGLDLAQAVKRSFFIRSLKQSCPTLESLDLSKVHIDNLEASITIEDAPQLKFLNLADVRSESRCLGLLTSASRCSNLVSLNLRNATSGLRYWQKEELDGLVSVLQNCLHLQHLNISGIHIHDGDTSLVDILVSQNISAFRSLAVSACCLVSNGRSQQSTESASYVKKGFGKRQRVSRYPVASTSSAVDGGIDVEADLTVLYKACPHLQSLEIINTGFSQSQVHSRNKSFAYLPCVVSRQFMNSHLSQLAQWSGLKYLQLTGLPEIRNGRAFRDIAEGCTGLERLFLAYIGSHLPMLWDDIQYFEQLTDLRLENYSMDLGERFFTSCLGCKKLQRLVVVTRPEKFEEKALETYIQKASNLYVIQLFTDMTLKLRDKLQPSIQKRYEKERPGFQIVLENINLERVSHVLEAMPLVHLDEITDLSSKVAAKPVNSILGV